MVNNLLVHSTKVHNNMVILDVDECNYSGMRTCDDSSRADCMNTEGSYECVCKENYKGDGRSCRFFGNVKYRSFFSTMTLFILDASTCDGICDHHCDYQSAGADPTCACYRGYYLASDEITCIGND